MIELSSFQNGLKHLYSTKAVSTLRAELCKVITKLKIAMGFDTLGLVL